MEDLPNNILFLMLTASIMMTVFTFGIIIFARGTYRAFKVWKSYYDEEKLFHEKMKERALMSIRGEMHDWISMPINGRDLLVCKKTGWCPAINGFVYKEEIEKFLKRQKIEERYQKYRDAKVKELAEELKLSIEKTEEIVEKVFDIKKQFHLILMDESLEEMRQQIEERDKGLGMG